MRKAVFWDATPCCSCKNRCFGGMYRPHHQGGKQQRARNNVSSNLQLNNAAKNHWLCEKWNNKMGYKRDGCRRGGGRLDYVSIIRAGGWQPMVWSSKSWKPLTGSLKVVGTWHQVTWLRGPHCRYALLRNIKTKTTNSTTFSSLVIKRFRQAPAHRRLATTCWNGHYLYKPSTLLLPSLLYSILLLPYS
jgi:hypothetical protein